MQLELGKQYSWFEKTVGHTSCWIISSVDSVLFTRKWGTLVSVHEGRALLKVGLFGTLVPVSTDLLFDSYNDRSGGRDKLREMKVPL